MDKTDRDDISEAEAMHFGASQVTDLDRAIERLEQIVVPLEGVDVTPSDWCGMLADRIEELRNETVKALRVVRRALYV